MEKIVRLKSTQKYKVNPFVNNGVLKIDRGKKTIIAGGTKDVMVDTQTGDVTGMAMLHKYKEVDKNQFIKIYIDEVKSLFDLSKTGIRAFNYVLSCMLINKDEIYLNIHKLVEYAEWSNTSQAYKGLGELIANKIIAPSVEPNIWFINPNVIFNGDRIAFIREYRMKEKKDNLPDPLLPLFGKDYSLLNNDKKQRSPMTKKEAISVLNLNEEQAANLSDDEVIYL
jgi:hypothetical protein